MANITVDKDGNRIKTDILTSGYLRQEIERVYKVVIPSEIKQLCFGFWFLNVCDEWAAKICKHDRIKFDGQIVRNTETNLDTQSVFGTHSVSSGQYIWRLHLKRVW